ncbi:hypothetical protein QT971_25820 [Microcoleus sp. herbarium19]|uniref:hypothetical protein n=1 Tax=unclassified Microcoleus TaxID=2642155 RepID=UPI002FD2EE13
MVFGAANANSGQKLDFDTSPESIAPGNRIPEESSFFARIFRHSLQKRQKTRR